FLGAEMTAWLKKQGIQRELTTAYTPQSNGVAERANRTILETARALLIESGVGSSMWPHAVRHATVARNRVLTKVGNESWVPLERWLGRKPPVDMLRVFGCMAVAHVPKMYRSKLGASAIWCVHLGLAAESKGWLLWEPSKGVLFDSRDVKFVEGMMYGGWKKQPETKVSQQMEQITMQLDLTPSVWEEGEEAAAEYSASAQVKQKGVEVLKEKGELLGEGKLFLTCFTDATWASEKDDSSSVGVYICIVGGGPVSWRSKKQTETALSSVESEYMAMFHGVKEVIWLRRLLEEIGQEQKVATPLFCDSKGALGMARNAVLHGLNKHIRIKWHWLRKEVKRGTVNPIYIKTHQQPADFLTKRLADEPHWRCMRMSGMSMN
ncbi:unnamed protein product, partial [Closterium sp. NIES-54]